MNTLLGLPGPLTHRQYLAWREWQELEWNRPSRSDHYLMQLAHQVYLAPYRVWWKQPGKLATEQEFRLKFRPASSQSQGAAPDKTYDLRTKASAEEAAKISKVVWAARLGFVAVDRVK